jgi:hypothetical protein
MTKENDEVLRWNWKTCDKMKDKRERMKGRQKEEVDVSSV